jgi:hypothetical protein
LSPIFLLTHIKIKTYTIAVLPVVLYGCETRSLTLREGAEKILVPKRDEITRE